LDAIFSRSRLIYIEIVLIQPLQKAHQKLIGAEFEIFTPLFAEECGELLFGGVEIGKIEDDLDLRLFEF
jgi:hypothetical protein